jgi:hypothetical protein
VLPLLIGLAMAAPQPVNPGDCVLSAIPEAQHATLGEALLARRTEEGSNNPALTRATDACARRYRLSVDKALHASGYAGMHLASEAVARQLGHPELAGLAGAALRERTAAQRLALSKPGSGEAEFRLVVGRMIESDPALKAALRAADDARASRFILMVRLSAVAEVERDLAAIP